MLFLVLVTSTKHYWVVSAERRRATSQTHNSSPLLRAKRIFTLARSASALIGGHSPLNFANQRLLETGDLAGVNGMRDSYIRTHIRMIHIQSWCPELEKMKNLDD